MSRESRAQENALHAALDVDHDYARAAGAVRKLRFLDKVRDEIEHTLEALEE
jgi:DnaJ-domain-containing protein 1